MARCHESLGRRSSATHLIARARRQCRSARLTGFCVSRRSRFSRLRHPTARRRYHGARSQRRSSRSDVTNSPPSPASASTTRCSRVPHAPRSCLGNGRQARIQIAHLYCSRGPKRYGHVLAQRKNFGSNALGAITAKTTVTPSGGPGLRLSQRKLDKERRSQA